MKNALSFILLLGVVIILYGCPYQSTVPLDQYASVAVTSELLGTWRNSTYPHDSTEIIFSKKSDDEYYINATLKDELNGYRHYLFTAYFSYVKDGQILNVKSDDNYYFVALLLKEKTLSLKPLSEDITTKKFSSPDEARHFVEDLYTNSTVKYDEDSQLPDLQKIK